MVDDLPPALVEDMRVVLVVHLLLLYLVVYYLFHEGMLEALPHRHLQ
jgi:hypothetical protein